LISCPDGYEFTVEHRQQVLGRSERVPEVEQTYICQDTELAFPFVHTYPVRLKFLKISRLERVNKIVELKVFQQIFLLRIWQFSLLLLKRKNPLLSWLHQYLDIVSTADFKRLFPLLTSLHQEHCQISPSKRLYKNLSLFDIVQCQLDYAMVSCHNDSACYQTYIYPLLEGILHIDEEKWFARYD
jgi:hypothetical protein